MTPKERVHTALRHEEPDRVPLFMWFHPHTAAMLARYLEIPEERVDEGMFNDVRQVWVGNNHPMEGVRLKQGERYTDHWGIDWIKEGPFNQIITHPLSDADPETIRKYLFPYEHIDELTSNLDALEESSSQYFIGCDTSPCLFEMYNRLRGMEHALLDITLYPELFSEMMEKSAAHSIALSEAACTKYSFDWLWTGDDVGGQRSLMMSPLSWRRAIKPHLANIFEVGKTRNLWVAFHSCGAVREIIPDLIEIGLDVLNPIQCNCPGMEPEQLKKEFGNSLTFMGGIDTQGLLPNGSPKEIEERVGTLIDTMAAGGGYILAASHTIPPETPLENIFSLYNRAGISQEMILDKAQVIRNLQPAGD